MVKSVLSNILVISIATAAAYLVLTNARPLPPAAPDAVRVEMADAVFYDALATETPVRLSDFRGSVLLVNLWATWCPPCVVELPSLDLLQAKLGDRNFRVITISMDRGDAAKIPAFLKERGVERLPAYWDKDYDIPRKWTYGGLPASFLIGADGRLIEKFEGPRKWDSGEVFEKIKAQL
jgi:thiol-disulfide isomerase/thioredoxin